MNSDKSYKSKNLQIEGLRGVAMLLVLCFHYFYTFPHDYVQGNNPFRILLTDYWGEIGVCFFLLISGYFMVPKRKVDGISYLISRLKKVWPLYFISITIVFLLTRLISLPNRTVSLINYLLNIPFINGYIGKPYVDHAHWYLTTLVGAIVVFSFIINLKPKARHIFYCVWIIILIGLYYFDSSNSALHLARSGLYVFLGKDYSLVIIVGAIIADFDSKTIDKYGVIALVLATIAKLLLGSISKMIELPLVFLFFYLCVHSKLNFMNNPIFKWLGRISYPTYLIHQNVGYIFILLLVESFGKYSVWMSLVAIPFGLVLGFGLYYIETIIHRLLNNINKNKT